MLIVCSNGPDLSLVTFTIQTVFGMVKSIKLTFTYFIFPLPILLFTFVKFSNHSNNGSLILWTICRVFFNTGVNYTRNDTNTCSIIQQEFPIN